MALGSWRAANQHVERLFNGGGVAGLNEKQLLDRVAAQRDDAAFEALVARHGPMVLTVCRRLLRDPNDVDDAFQATFLVLLRRAASVQRRELLANWLYGVAWRVALRARSIAARRSHQQGTGLDELPAVEAPEPAAELRDCLHEEVRRLPEKYRAPVVLCYLEGLTHDDAAGRLGWPVGTVKGRLARARDLLRTRLARRGLSAGSALALLAELPREASAAVPPALAESMLRTGASWLSTHGAGIAAGPVLTLTEGVVSAMNFAKLKGLGIVAVIVAGVVAAGATVLPYHSRAQEQNAPKEWPDPAPVTKPQKQDRRAAEKQARPARGAGSAAKKVESRSPNAGSPASPTGMPAGSTVIGGGGFDGTGTTPGARAKIRMEVAIRQDIARLSAQFPDPTPRGKAILAKLEEPVSMSFAKETPFELVLKYIKSATQGPKDSGIPVYVDPEGLDLAETTMQSPIVMDLEGVPLRVTLRLLLRQLGLAYCVKDGMLMISHPDIIAGELEELKAMNAVQQGPP